jgi:hypothetical protein
MTRSATTTPQSTPSTEPSSAALPQSTPQAAQAMAPPAASTQPASAPPAWSLPADRLPSSPQDEAYRRIVAQIEAGQYEAALKGAQVKSSTDIRLRNAAGVCLLRLGRPAAAVQLFRPLVFAPDGLTLLRDVPDVVRLNFATALLLDGRSSGCTDMLRQVDRKLPGAQQLRRSIRAWKSQLSLWKRLCWVTGVGAPQKVTLDYVPGELL